MTLEQSKQSVLAAEAAATRAADEAARARSDLSTALDALRAASPEEPNRQQLTTREQAVIAGKAQIARTEHLVRRANLALKDAQERHAALASHAAALQKLEKVRLAVAEADRALTEEGAALVARFAGRVKQLEKLLAEADVAFAAVPPPVRFRYLTHPAAAAPTWAKVRLDSTEILLALARALQARGTTYLGEPVALGPQEARS